MLDNVLVVDDESLVRELLEETIAAQGVQVQTACSGEEAIEELRDGEFQMAFVDMRMGELSGMDVLKFAREHSPQMVFIIMTAYGSIETAVEAMRLGAFDFISKPFPPEQTEVLLEKGEQWLQVNAQNQYFRRQTVADNGSGSSAGSGDDTRLIGSSPALSEARGLAERVAPTQATVLITGESGTGKELIAGEIHRHADPDQSRPYVRMNCAAVPETLLESELFGHEKGAFTGAAERRIGRFELADGGTLLLDEIGEISLAMQAKLLRVLQENEFERVGGSKTISTTTRVIATTNRDLQAAVRDGEFREDLFYRLNVFPVHLPPLRERSEDAVELAEAFLARQARKLQKELAFSDGALKLIRSYHWPGNVRELENVIERLAILADHPTIEANALPLDLGCASGTALNDSWDMPTLNIHEIERRAVLQALKRTGGKRQEAADLLGFSVRTLRNKINEYRKEGLLEGVL